MGWAGVAPGAIGKVAVKPLKEIMQQESLMSSSPEVSRPAINSWAAKIGTGASSAPSTVSSSSSLQPSRAPSNSYQQQPTSPRQQPQPLMKPVPLPVIRDMAPSMVEWCITTMKGIIGSDFDGTGLLEILVSLESPVDIREIISETLGSTPQVRARKLSSPRGVACVFISPLSQAPCANIPSLLFSSPVLAICYRIHKEKGVEREGREVTLVRFGLDLRWGELSSVDA